MTDTLRSDKATGEEPNRRDNPRFAGAATRARAGGPPPGQTRLREGQNRRRKTYARIGWINLDSGEFSSVSWEFSLVSSWFPSGLAGSGGGRPEFSGEPGEPRCLGREWRAQGARRDRLEACPTLKPPHHEDQNWRRKAYARIGWFNLDSGEFSLVSGWLAGSGGGRPGFSGFPGLRALDQWLPLADGESSSFDAIDSHISSP